MSMSAILPPKKDVALALLERASVFIHLDPRGESVRVPNWLKNQPQLVLQVGLNMAVSIPDLAVNDDSLSCTLSFSRRPQFCQVPWSAVYALVGEDGRGMIWPEDIPAEVAAQSQQPPGLRSVEGKDKRPRTKRRTTTKAVEPPSEAPPHRAVASSRPNLVALPGEKAGVAGAAAPPTTAVPARPHLRLVK